MAGSATYEANDADVGRYYPIIERIGWMQLGCYANVAIDEGGATSFALGATNAGVGIGAPVLTEIGALGVVAPLLVAGDELDGVWMIPHNINWSLPIGIRVIYNTASATGTDTHTWIVLASVIAEGAAHAIATGALDTIVAVDTESGVANAWERTARGLINGDTLTEANVMNGDFLSINIELDATDASEAIHFWGLMIDYMPKNYQGQVQSFVGGLQEG